MVSYGFHLLRKLHAVLALCFRLLSYSGTTCSLKLLLRSISGFCSKNTDYGWISTNWGGTGWMHELLYSRICFLTCEDNNISIIPSPTKPQLADLTHPFTSRHCGKHIRDARVPRTSGCLQPTVQVSDHRKEHKAIIMVVYPQMRRRGLIPCTHAVPTTAV